MSTLTPSIRNVVRKFYVDMNLIRDVGVHMRNVPVLLIVDKIRSLIGTTQAPSLSAVCAFVLNDEILEVVAKPRLNG